MADQDKDLPIAGDSTSSPTSPTFPNLKGKGKASDTPQDVTVEDEEDTSEEEDTGAEEDVTLLCNSISPDVARN